MFSFLSEDKKKIVLKIRLNNSEHAELINITEETAKDDLIKVSWQEVI